ncbi:unnamed protein product [Euphydryas editha]|uniref:Uncharacterized protein n=1 Tax=Euphydryas editha TaxID=104508 RepID=A0AAU9TEU4_EUPED|nr:unnamed protein product [Euphydryas editha]
MLEFIVARVHSVPILGRHACTELDLVRRVMSVRSSDSNPDFLIKFKDVFRGLGCLPGQYKIHLKEDAKPVVHAPRKLPFAIKEEVKKKLMEMESQKS